MELLGLYERMLASRYFEMAVADLWRQGLIPGEMHLGTGEEAVAAGVAARWQDGDAAAVDHRGTPFLLTIGVDPVGLLREMLGKEDGLCRGRGGHMHLFSPGHLAASSGIVGAAGPAAAGFALAGTRLRPGSVAVAFFGDGAINQGMLLESLNLAVAWSLPVIFVCKDNEWAITTRSSSVTGGELLDRARGFGLPASDVDGVDVLAVAEAVGEAFARARRGKGPWFLRARCARLDGHFLGDPMVRMADHPISEGKETLGRVLAAAVSGGGAGLGARVKSLTHMMSLMRKARTDRRSERNDPIARAARRLAKERVSVEEVEERVLKQTKQVAERALNGSV